MTCGNYEEALEELPSIKITWRWGEEHSLITLEASGVGTVSRVVLRAGSGVATPRASGTYGVSSVGKNLPLSNLLVGGQIGPLITHLGVD